MGAHIRPEGWENWGKASNETTAYYAEYGSTGPGATSEDRVKWSHQLTPKEARRYTLQAIFGGPAGWAPTRR
jgi:pectinesterase